MFCPKTRVLTLRQKSELRSSRAPAQFSDLRSGLCSGWQSGVALWPALRPLERRAPTALQPKIVKICHTLKMAQKLK